MRMRLLGQLCSWHESAPWSCITDSLHVGLPHILGSIRQRCYQTWHQHVVARHCHILSWFGQHRCTAGAALPTSKDQASSKPSSLLLLTWRLHACMPSRFALSASDNGNSG
jgi:hypothetical protein